EIIHTWRRPALRFAAAAALRTSCRLVASPFSVRHECHSKIGKADGWLLRRAWAIIATSQSEADLLKPHRISGERLFVVPPAVKVAESGPLPQISLSDQLGLPKGARFIVCVGPLEAQKGYLDAIWAFDILKFLYADLHLVIAGEGPDRERLERFVRS